VYGLPEEYGQQQILANYAIQKSGKQLMAEKLHSAQLGPHIVSPEEFQKAKERKAAADKQKKLLITLGAGVGIATLLGLGTFFILRRKKMRGAK
jgi:hypothetical protein